MLAALASPPPRPLFQTLPLRLHLYSPFCQPHPYHHALSLPFQRPPLPDLTFPTLLVPVTLRPRGAAAAPPVALPRPLTCSSRLVVAQNRPQMAAVQDTPRLVGGRRL